MPRTAITAALGLAGLAALGTAAAVYVQRAAARWVYEGVQIGVAFAETRRNRDSETTPA